MLLCVFFFLEYIHIDPRNNFQFTLSQRVTLYFIQWQLEIRILPVVVEYPDYLGSTTLMFSVNTSGTKSGENFDRRNGEILRETQNAAEG